LATQPSARQLGYFAAAWRCRCVVAGQAFDSATYRKVELHVMGGFFV